LCFRLKCGCRMCCLARVGRQGNGRSKVVSQRASTHNWQFHFH
jgi:hypothetical protein